MPAQSMITLVVPSVLILLAVPLIFEKVPRNIFYGFRTPLTMSSDEVWYYANRVAGITLSIAGLLWLGLGQILPAWIGNDRSAARLLTGVGAVFVIAGCGIAYYLTNRKYGR